MKLTIEIDDVDRFDEAAETTPWTLCLMTDATGGELIEIGSETALVGHDIPAMLRELADRWPAVRDDEHAELVTLDLEIENAYADEVVTTIVRSVVVPVPESLEDDVLDEWAWDHLADYTGTGEGRADDDATYTVTITAASLGTLTDRIFEMG